MGWWQLGWNTASKLETKAANETGISGQPSPLQQKTRTGLTGETIQSLFLRVFSAPQHALGYGSKIFFFRVSTL
ncbi:MAG: hypothetical protein CMM01_11510 [Rhodopirellula sp.]|nr:hypothetical protein [Rhodopirellula sp.]OUX51180.1 MAG: hypothetical protein CBE43_04320 [Rhodopirellula sp. TMED283]